MCICPTKWPSRLGIITSALGNKLGPSRDTLLKCGLPVEVWPFGPELLFWPLPKPLNLVYLLSFLKEIHLMLFKLLLVSLRRFLELSQILLGIFLYCYLLYSFDMLLMFLDFVTMLHIRLAPRLRLPKPVPILVAPIYY